MNILIRRVLALFFFAGVCLGVGSASTGCGSEGEGGCKSTTIFAGDPDGFSGEDGPELMVPPPGFPPEGVTASEGFDKQNHNKVFAQRLDTPVASGKCLTNATLTILMTPTPPDDPGDDMITLQAGTARYVAFLGKPGSIEPPTLLPASWANEPDFLFTIDVTPLLADIAANQYLDVTVGDDTAIDHIKWLTRTCPCESPAPTRFPNADLPSVTPALGTPAASGAPTVPGASAPPAP